MTTVSERRSGRRGRGVVGRGAARLAGAALAGLLVACGDATAPEDERPRLDRIEIVQGEGQSAVEGEWLPQSIIAEAIVGDSALYFGTVFVRTESGNGGIELGPARGAGNGVTLQGLPLGGFMRVEWQMGTAGVEQRLTFFALRAPADTVFASVTAVSLPPGS